MSVRSLIALFPLALLGATAAAAPVGADAAGAAGPSAHQPPSLRVDDRARPVRYRVRVNVQPDQPTFSAAIDIDLKLQRATDLLWLNATELQVKQAVFTVGGEKIPARVVAGNNEFVGFAVVKPIAAGPATLHIDYSGPISRRDDRGIFAQKEGDRWYAITQFESIFARRAFPCFDQPDMKTPWQVTLEVPEKLATLSNTRITGTKSEHPGMKTVAFAETAPLPSYLVAFAVGPYDIVEAGRAGLKQTPIRVAVPTGRAGDATWAAKVSGELLGLLEQYFGMPFPFDKLDNVSIPITSTFGAMENVGMVTYANSILVAKRADEGLRFQRGYAETAAHEYAHQWFGDLVTTAWWDDIWLNESFATWMENKIIDAWRPNWFNHTGTVERREQALRADALVSARRIRQPIATIDDIYNAFDSGITYAKGSVVLAMFERFVGPETFQRGVRAYLKAHANGNATVDDFVGAISSAAGRDIAPAFKSFLDQPGAPLVAVKLQCAAGQAPALALTQQRFLPVGSKGSTNQRWQIPLCARWVAGGKSGRTCGIVSDAQATLPLTEATSCPTWLLANDGGAGYFRSNYGGDVLAKLLGEAGRKLLDLPETIGLLDDVSALTQAGRMPMADALGMTPWLSKDPRRQVAEQSIQWASRLHGHLVPPSLRPQYARYIQKVYGERARTLGWTPHSGEDEDTRLLRPELVGLVADEGEDPTLRAQAKELALRWLADRKAIDADVADVVLHVAARAGDRALFDRYLAEAKHSSERRDRRRLLSALAAFPGAALNQAALDVVASEDFDARETMGILIGIGREPAARELGWKFLQSHFDLMLKRLSPELMGESPRMVSDFCDEQHGHAIASFFHDRLPQLPGGPRNLDQALERIQLCGALVGAQQASVTSFLKSY
jgi:alanyl aminopeptidase